MVVKERQLASVLLARLETTAPPLARDLHAYESCLSNLVVTLMLNIRYLLSLLRAAARYISGASVTKARTVVPSEHRF
jgi:hypothetical protein